MIVKGQPNAGEPGRTLYELAGFETRVTHFVVRHTTPENPFGPHKHEQTEMWYMISGSAFVTGEGLEQPVEAGDLITIEPWVEHGLRTDARATWICLG